MARIVICGVVRGLFDRGAGEGLGFLSSSSLSLSESESESSDSLVSVSLGFAGVRATVDGVEVGTVGRGSSVRCVIGVSILIIGAGASEASSSDEVSTSVVFDSSACVLAAVVSSSSLELSTTGVGGF
jgi:hypothetical protein